MLPTGALTTTNRPRGSVRSTFSNSLTNQKINIIICTISFSLNKYNINAPNILFNNFFIILFIIYYIYIISSISNTNTYNIINCIISFVFFFSFSFILLFILFIFLLFISQHSFNVLIIYYKNKGRLNIKTTSIILFIRF